MSLSLSGKGTAVADPLLNYVRCPYCGGNLADMNHPCDDEARDRAAKEAVESMMAAFNTPPEKATKDQLRRKLIECEAALASTEAALEDHEAAVSALRRLVGALNEVLQIHNTLTAFGGSVDLAPELESLRSLTLTELIEEGDGRG